MEHWFVLDVVQEKKDGAVQQTGIPELTGQYCQANLDTSSGNKYSSRNVTMHSDNIIHRSIEAASTLGFLVIAWTVLRCPILIRAQVTDF